MEPSIHDNRLISYSVHQEKREIVFETVFSDKTPHEFTSIIFSDAIAYEFMHHSLTSDTILFGIDEVAAGKLVEENWGSFENGRDYGWPGAWSRSIDSAKKFIERENVKGFEISSSLGLSGWILAKSVRLLSKTSA